MTLSGGDNITTTGFIGAGKCGMSLAYYFRSKGINVSGFSSRHPKETETEFDFLSTEQILQKSDIIFLTVTDAAISEVWNGFDKYDLTNKIICHCSGSLTSDILSGADHNSVCSVHPMLAFNSRHTSEHDIEQAFFTLEGGEKAVNIISQILSSCGNKFSVIKKEDKAKYHAAACFASNFVVALCDKAESLLTECGFTADMAHTALSALMKNNMDNIIKCGTKKAITGPAARGDMITINKHLSVLSDDDGTLYKGLTNIIMDMKSEEHL